MTLVAVAKNGEYLEIHPATLKEHQSLGWWPTEKRVVVQERGAPPDDSKPLAVDDGLDTLDTDALRTLAQERGVTVRSNASAETVRKALREAAGD